MNRFLARWIHVWLAVLFAWSNLGCAPTLSIEYLHLLNPSAPVFSVCRKPPTVEPDAKVWAFLAATNETVSDHDPRALERFVPAADALYAFDPDAPAISVRTLPAPHFNLSCNKPASILAPRERDRKVVDGPCRGRDCKLPLSGEMWLDRQKWHIELDEEIADWIGRNRDKTPKDFEAYLHKRYAEPKVKAAFPNGLGATP